MGLLKKCIKKTILYRNYTKWKIKKNQEILIKKNAQNGCIFEDNSVFDSNCTFEGKNRLAKGVKLNNVKLGRGTYIEEDAQLINTVIGRYCSIASHVTNIIGTHPTHKFVSTHPAFYSLSLYRGYTFSDKQKFNEYKWVDDGIANIIGNDVWIGANVNLLQGVAIGDGAIVGANSLVIRNVPPYAIVGGVPAHIIGYRFNEDEIDYLLKCKWWDKSEKWIIEHSKEFEDINQFMNVTDLAGGETLC